ncbi:MAG: bifunctional methylenetetrahydrofolate dehydrogenase/methenyltetrahydrofolate cyclohydrolase FolD [Bacteroidales bacterium]|nr:bifunctional methylenetetrahydrofolate dehydrogenase/methenyltetrahydrofolate cyclohydrolase FolD [Bacteroidales bacterium]MCF8333354.1 bifunctional methylenetetrahydrofolate dehydrogenase/methenyltetrahydrofolate cyclohydrolase FolD [Bacteroidales bacterium]
MNLIDGKEIADQVKEEIKKEVSQIIDNDDKAPHLAAILVGEDPASQTYVKNKEKACKRVGMISSVYNMPAQTSQEELLETVDFLNNDPEVDGFIVQLPLPDHIDEDTIIQAIKPEKDVDGFHPVNLGKMMLGQPAFLSATPNGIMELLERSDIDTQGKHCVVLGRSNIVGRPISVLMSQKAKPGNATVTVCHSRTRNLEEYVKQADILIAAMGKQEFVTADMVKDNVVVIDVGIHRVTDDTKKKGYRLVGDVDFEEVKKKASAITPVPGGVGPMTIASLLKNTLKAAKKGV